MNKSGEIDPQKEALQILLDQAAYGRLDRRAALRALGALGLAAAASMPGFEQAFAAGATQKRLVATEADTFDVIVIGGGSAGAVVAARASEDSHRQVLLLEAGPTDEGVASIANPLVWFTNIQSACDWKYSYTPQEAVRQRTILIPRGKVLGGSSSINGMLYLRGHSLEYDQWAQRGCQGWSFDQVLPYFKKTETNSRGADEWHGDNGPMGVKQSRLDLPICDAFLAAAGEAGYPVVDDLNADVAEGFFWASQNPCCVNCTSCRKAQLGG